MATLTLTACANTAAQLLGVLDSGEALSTQQIADALVLANNLWDNWSADPKMILTITRVAAALSSGVQGYTIGAGQTFNVTRPAAIVSAAFLNSSGPGGEVKVLTPSQWAGTPDRQRQSYIIQGLFYDRGNPTGNLYLTPVPQGTTLSLEVWVWAALAQFVDATTPLTMLPSYQRLLTLAMAMEMAPEYSMTPSQKLTDDYQAAVANVEELNASLLGTLTDAQKQNLLQAAGQ